MKYIFFGLLILIGTAIGVYIGLGGLANIGWVAFIIVFPLIFIFGTIIFGRKSEDDIENDDDLKVNSWEKYE